MRNWVERKVMLAVRLADGCPVEVLGPAGQRNAASLAAQAVAAPADRLISPSAYAGGRIVLTRRGRLLADTVTRALTE